MLICHCSTGSPTGHLFKSWLPHFQPSSQLAAKTNTVYNTSERRNSLEGCCFHEKQLPWSGCVWGCCSEKLGQPGASDCSELSSSWIQIGSRSHRAQRGGRREQVPQVPCSSQASPAIKEPRLPISRFTALTRVGGCSLSPRLAAFLQVLLAPLPCFLSLIFPFIKKNFFRKAESQRGKEKIETLPCADLFLKLLQ